MTRRTLWTVAAVGAALAASSACAPPQPPARTTASLEVRIERGRPVIVEELDHYSPEVLPGERVTWACPGCPEGTRFRIRDVRPDCDSEFVPEDLRHYHEGQKELLLEALEAHEEPGLDPEADPEAAAKEADIQAHLRALIDELPATDLPQAPENPFEGNWTPPTEFSARVESAPVKAGIRGCHFYKFTWEVEGAELAWDPHIYIHGGGGRR